MNKLIAGAPLVLLCACVPMTPMPLQTSIVEDLKAASAPKPRVAPPAPVPAAVPQAVPPAVNSALLPPLAPPVAKTMPGQLEHRFDLSVTDAPVSQVFMAIVADTPYSILLSPKTVTPVYTGAAGPGSAPAQTGTSTRTSDTITVNLKNVTVPEALDAIRELYGYEYTVEGTRIYVQPPELRTKLYHVNYVVGQRRGVSDMQVVAGAAPNSSSGGGSGNNNNSNNGGGNSGSSSSGSAYSSLQSTGLSTVAKSDVWGEIEDAVRTALGCVVPNSVPIRATAGAGSSGGSGSSSATNAPSSRADVTFFGDSQLNERVRGNQGCVDGRAFVVNQVSGTALVRAMPRELRQIEAMLRSMQLNIDRQVIIEAKIIDVTLNDGSQQGINWSALSGGLHRASLGSNPNLIVDGTSFARRAIGSATTDTTGTVAGPSLGDLLGGGLIGTSATNAFNAGVGIALQATNFSALINFLETQGRVQVLSSPRIATLNNQKAVLKVGSEEPFVTNISGGTTTTNATTGTVSSPPTINYQPFFAGIALDVTPQIDEMDNVTLHVHSLVNSITEKPKVALPTSNVTVPFAVNSVSETDSMVKTRDGQIIVIGGLMTESASDNRARVPLAGQVPIVGAAFGKAEKDMSKRELVILLKPTVVKGDDTWASDVAASQGRIEKFTGLPPPPVPMPIPSQ